MRDASPSALSAPNSPQAHSFRTTDNQRAGPMLHAVRDDLPDDDVHAPGRGIAFAVALSLLLWPIVAGVLGAIAIMSAVP